MTVKGPVVRPSAELKVRTLPWSESVVGANPYGAALIAIRHEHIERCVQRRLATRNPEDRLAPSGAGPDIAPIAGHQTEDAARQRRPRKIAIAKAVEPSL